MMECPSDYGSDARPRPARSGWHRRGAALLALVVSMACGSGNGGPDSTPDREPPRPFLTEVGIPTGDPVVDGGIGTTVGGTIDSPDGRLTMLVPEGAVSGPTAFSVQPITNKALGGVGGAFRLGPEGARFQKPVTLVLRVPDDHGAVDIEGLGIAYQDASGFWFPVLDVRRDAVANTLTVETDHFSDWGIVWQDGVPGLYGPFTLSQTLGAIPFDASGTATLFYKGDSDTTTLYVLTGSVTPTSINPVAGTCSPETIPPDQTLVPGNAEIRKSPAQFRWSINARWDLTCTEMSPPEQFMGAIFDTLGLNVGLGGCTRGYQGTPVIGTGGVQGIYTIDCGLAGSATATWNFVPCVPGLACSDPALNECMLQADSCATGTPVCEETTSAVADGTACGTDLLEQCSTGQCLCIPGESAACPPVDACHTAAVTCDPVLGPACTQTPIAPGACDPVDACNTAAWSCDPVTGPVCTQTPIAPGACDPVDACNTAAWSCDPATGPACTQTPIAPAACDPVDACNTATWSCDPVTGPACTQTPIAPGACDPVDACNTAAWSCDPATGPACTQTPIAPGACDPVDACNTAAWSCDPIAGPACTQTPAVDGTSCPGGVCGGGVCNACTPDDPCTSSDPCHTATLQCGSGFPVCTDNGNVADGTACGTGLLEQCVTGTCTCVPGPSAACPSDDCNTGTVTCGIEGAACALTPVAEGTLCNGGAGTCTGGTCN